LTKLRRDKPSVNLRKDCTGSSCHGASKTSVAGFARRRMSERRGTLGYFQEILKEEEIDGQDLMEGIREKYASRQIHQSNEEVMTTPGG
jgi:hypothetical protein